jgi:large subunit ribosomal protein L24
MQKKLKIKKDDTVKVIAGTSKGQTGKVLAVNRETNRVTVEGVNIVSKHTKPSAASPQGGIVKQEAAIHISNVMLVVGSEATRVGRKHDDNGNLVRYSKKTGEVIN